jgi:hypothetical protein
VSRCSKADAGINDAALVFPTASCRRRNAAAARERENLSRIPVSRPGTRRGQTGRNVRMAARTARIFLPRIPDEMPPSASVNQRHVQIKTLGARFPSQAIKDSVWQLRLLPRPRIRSGNPQRPDPEAAAFAFCQDTDPEVLLILENRLRDDQAGRKYAVLPITGWGAN